MRLSRTALLVSALLCTAGAVFAQDNNRSPSQTTPPGKYGDQAKPEDKTSTGTQKSGGDEVAAPGSKDGQASPSPATAR